MHKVKINLKKFSVRAAHTSVVPVFLDPGMISDRYTEVCLLTVHAI